MATTRKDIRQRIGKVGFCGDMIASTATSGSTSALSDTSLANIDDTFIGAQLVITSAITDRRWVTDYVGSTGTFTPDRDFTSAISTNSYEVHRTFSADKKDEAINGAIQDSGMRWARVIEDTSLVFAANTYTYSLDLATDPDQIALLEKIEYDSGASGAGYPFAFLDEDFYSVRVNGSTYTLQFKPNVNGIIANGKTLRLTFRVRPSILSSDSSPLAPDNDAFIQYICAKATARLAHDKANHASGRAQDDWRNMAVLYEGITASFAQDTVEPQPGKVIFPVLGSTRYVEPAPGRIRIP